MSATVAEVCATVRAGAGLYDLPDHGSFTLVGPDARRFCNGMFTNNIRALTPGRGNASAMVDDKARIQGLLRLYNTAPEAFLAVLEGVTPEAFAARYEKYIIFDDVELTDTSEDLAVLSLQGPQAAAVLARLELPTPGPGEHAEGAWRVAEHARTRAGGWDLIGPRAERATMIDRALAAGAVAVPFDAQEVLRIEAGLPRWPADMSDKSLLHELRLVGTHGAFDKGCYIGQEVINRIDVMGQVTKKIWGLELASPAPAPQTEVQLAGEAVGHTLSGAVEGDRARVLALLRKAAWTDGLEVTVMTADGPRAATVRDLPF
jgi:folate-binding protein YgfZ